MWLTRSLLHLCVIEISLNQFSHDLSANVFIEEKVGDGFFFFDLELVFLLKGKETKSQKNTWVNLFVNIEHKKFVKSKSG